MRCEELQSFKLIALDYAGFGERRLEAYQGDPMDYAVAEIARILRNETQNACALVGHSMGGAISLLLNKTVSPVALVSIEGNMIAEDCGFISRRMAAAEDERVAVGVKKSIMDGARTAKHPGQKMWAEDVAPVKTQTLRDYSKSLVKYSESGELLAIFNRLECAKSYIYSDEYVGHPLLGKIDNNVSYHIPDSGHFVMEDQPELCAKIIRQTLQRALPNR